MIFEEHYKKYEKSKKIKAKINKLENKKINLACMVDVQAVAPKNSLGGFTKEDKMMKYASELEEIEQNIKKNNLLLSEIKIQLKEKEEELRDSKELLDSIYLYKYIDKLKYYQISKKIGYSNSRTYDYIKEINQKIAKIRKIGKNRKNMGV